MVEQKLLGKIFPIQKFFHFVKKYLKYIFRVLKSALKGIFKRVFVLFPDSPLKIKESTIQCLSYLSAQVVKFFKNKTSKILLLYIMLSFIFQRF